MSHFRLKYTFSFGAVLMKTCKLDLWVGSGGEILTTSRQSLSAAGPWIGTLGKLAASKLWNFGNSRKDSFGTRYFYSQAHSLSGFMERFKSFKNAETCVKIRSFMFSRQHAAAQTSLVFLKCGCFIIILQLNPFNPCPSPQGSPELVSPGVGPVSPQHQTVDSNREKDCTDLYND